MKYQRIKIVGMACVICFITVMVGINVYNHCKYAQLLLGTGIESLAGNESGSLDCNYEREEGRCAVYVGVKGELRLLGGAILKAGADGYVRFDGKVVCVRGGNKTCKPVECVDLYQIL